MWRLALSVAAGVVHGFSMAWPASVLGNALGVTSLSSGLLQCVSLGVLAALLLQLATQDADASHHFPGFRASRPRQSAWRQGALLSALFACSAMAATWGWLYVSMHRYGGMPSWLAALAVLLLAAALSLYFAVAGAVWVALFRRWMLSGRLSKTLHEFRQALAGLVLFSALWTLAELCRGQLFTGFP
jgi:apolipoprotein N-acyltransferase